MSVWSNPYIKQAWESLPPEEQAMYKSAGEYIHSRDMSLFSSGNQHLIPTVQRIEQLFRDGLLAEDISEDDRAVLTRAYGSAWFSRYGFENDGKTA